MEEYDKKEIQIYITGDTHGLIDAAKLEYYNFPEGYNLTKDDLVIIAGDGGIVWDEKTDHKRIAYYESKPWTTLVVPGNHENYPLIKTYPKVKFHGAWVYKISDSIYYTERGEILEFLRLNGKTITVLCVSGAFSHDTFFRTEGIDWFREELPTQEEVDNTIKNLERYNYNVDYVISHDVPTTHNLTMGFQNLRGVNIMDKYRGKGVDKLFINICDFLQQIFERTTFRSWLAGHYHLDQKINGVQILYHGIAKITDENEQGYIILKTPVSEIMNRTYTKEELKFRFEMEGLFINYRKVGTYLDFGVMEPMITALEVFNYDMDEKTLRNISELYNEYCVRKFEKEFNELRKGEEIWE